MSNASLLIVEDEVKIAQLLVDYLQNDGFQTSVLNSGEKAVEAVRETSPEFVILDLMLPGKDGMTICREVRQFSNVPIMMLTAKVDEIDRLMGLEIGADDYVCKPFSPREVVARVNTILRRVQPESDTAAAALSEGQIKYRTMTLRPAEYLCLISDERVDLTPVEFRLLKAMVSRPGRVFSRENLMEASYPDGRVVSDRTVDSHVKNLRKKVLAVSGGKDFIQSVYGVGYKIE